MSLGKDSFLSRFKWLIVIYVALAVVFAIALLSDIFQTPQPGQIPQLVWLLGGLLILITIIVLLSATFKIRDELEENGQKIEKITESFEKIRATLVQVNQNTHLSETAKSIAFRDADKQALREAVFDKLQQQDFDGTYAIVDEISKVEGYQQLAEQLRAEADRYHDSTDSERVNQVIAHIDKLLDNHEWARASAQIERLIRSAPGSEKARSMRQRLIDKKEERKKILLWAWDDAVKREATDRSLEILRDLDQYLTPNEGLALQEAARSVFRNKLHSLGVQFSLAVSGRQWAQAIEAGREIVRGFPNSRMAEEIREKMEILKQRARR